MARTLEWITQYMDAFAEKDFSGVPFDADVTFCGPLLDQPLKGRDAVVPFLNDVAKQMSNVRLNQHVVQDEHACAVIQFEAGGNLIKACDYFRVSTDGISEIRVFFDPRPLLP